MENLINFYELLGISYYATTDEIKDAYRKKVKETHPDNSKGDSEQFKLIIEAYEVLSNDEKRKRYDEILFKATKFNVIVEIPKKEKEKVKTVNEKAEKNDKKPRKWKVASLVSLFVVIFLIGIVVHLNNQYQIVNYDNKLLDSQLADMKKENKEVHKDNRLLDSSLSNMKKENRELTEKVDSLQNEMIQMSLNVASVPASSPAPINPVSETTSGYVTLGSTEDEVNTILGTPIRIQFTRWYYGDSSWVSFDYIDKTVDGWNNDAGELKVK